MSWLSSITCISWKENESSLEVRLTSQIQARQDNTLSSHHWRLVSSENIQPLLLIGVGYIIVILLPLTKIQSFSNVSHTLEDMEQPFKNWWY